jgi:integrase
MNHDYPYLTKSPKTGIYGYRRDIPKDLRCLFGGKSTLKKSFKTKNSAVAQVELKRMNDCYDDMVKTSGLTMKAHNQDDRRIIKSVIEKLTQEDMLPENLPKLDYLSKDSEYNEAFKSIRTTALAKVKLDTGKIDAAEYRKQLVSMQNTNVWKLKEFSAKRDSLKDELHRKYRDVDAPSVESLNPNIDCDADDYAMTQLEWDERDPEVIEYRLMCGQPIRLLATWGLAVNNYIKRYGDTLRNPEQLIKHTKAVRSMCEAFGATMPNRMDTELSSIEDYDVRDFADKKWPVASTRLKNLGIMKAVWNSCKRHNPRQKAEFDPFVGTIKTARTNAKISQKDRRSFTEEEYKLFMESLEAESSPEIRLIAKLMAYCGALTIEVAKLQIRDLKLNAKTPYFICRSTIDSITGKPRIDRAIPLVDSILGEFRSYIDNEHDGGMRVFPKYGYGTHSSSDRSKAIKKHITNLCSSDDRELVPYSFRHTFRNKCRAVKQLSPATATYILGHNSKDDKRIHNQYGINMPNSTVVEDMKSINSCTHWVFK